MGFKLFSSEFIKDFEINSGDEIKEFKPAKSSRFEFVKEDNEEKINVPNFIQEILNSKFSDLLYLHPFNNNNNFYEDFIYENEKNQIWNWDEQNMLCEN